ncbi:MAG: adenylate kinase [Simkaniaceae bacterium]|nr:adenylate kinase [Candidatus Sacchlamyda saccharinae]
MIKIFLTLLFFMANLQATQTQVVILLGPPGAGKGSQATYIKEKMELAHISTGDLLRENIKAGTDLGKKAKSFMDDGKLVPDNLIFDMLFARVEKADCKKGYILDGFPRNIAQAEELQKRLSDNDVMALNLATSDSAIVERITKREICKSCQTPYHQEFSPSKVQGKCDQCDGELYQRSDDTKEVVENRLKIYHEQTAPLVDFYNKQKVLKTIDSNKSKEEVTAQILKALDN